MDDERTGLRGESRRRRAPRLGTAAGGWLALLALCAASFAEDWPTYRHDIERSGVTAEALKPPLSPCWVFRPRQAPQPAWGEPNPRPVGGWFGSTEGRRLQFDDVYHVAVAGGAVYFGSSADGKIRALEAATGKVRWSVFTDGPVRLAPTVHDGKVYVGSDDGLAYCLRASDGGEVWKFRAAPSGQKLLGSGKMVSLWPLRTGVLVDGGVAYLGAGIFPAEGVYLYAVDAASGKLLWCNDSGGAQPRSRISPQGYLLASKSTLFVPMGRVSPAGYARNDGRLLHETYFSHSIGGTYALLVGGKVVTGTRELVSYDQQSRGRFAWYHGRQIIVTKEVSYRADGREVQAMDRKSYPKVSLQRKGLLDKKVRLDRSSRAARQNVQRREATVKQGEGALKALDQKIAALTQKKQPVPAALQKQRGEAQKKLGAEQAALAAAKLSKTYVQWVALQAALKKANAAVAATVKWRCPTDAAESLILAGNVLFAGGNGKVDAIATADGKKLWTAKVDGLARGLAAADGRLYVSTNTGAIYCFGPQGSKDLGVVRQPTDPAPFPRDELTAVFEAAAQHILQTTGAKKGYCLVLGSGSGRLAYELAKRTDLRIYGVEADPQKVAAARKALDAAGLYGMRVRIDQGDPAQVPYADYFANLIGSESALVEGKLPGAAAGAFRMLKPLGGTICIGQPTAAKGKVKPLSAAALRQWASGAELKGAEVTEHAGAWLTFARGPLPGAGSWTHQYAEPGNTTCSDEQLLKAPLGLLWFGEPGPGKMADRHRRPAAPLAINGRMFIQGEGTANRIGGENAIMAYDAYNGVKLWERRVRGALRTVISHNGGNAAVNDDSFFIAAGDQCLRMDAATGETKRAYRVPPAPNGRPRKWGYVAVIGDTLYGSRSGGGRSADAVFALDLATGALRWKYEAKGIPQGAIAISDGTLFLARSDVTPEQRQEALKEQIEAIKKLSGSKRKAAEAKLKAAAVRLIVALDAATGKTLWQRPMDLTGSTGGAYWCSLGSIVNRGVVLLFGVYADGHYWKQFFAGQFESRRVFALSAKDGKRLWQKYIGYRVRPLVIGDTLHAEPWAFDIHTGQQRMRTHPVTGQEEVWQFARPGHHCGAPAASPNLMLFRSYTLGWYDLAGDGGTHHFGGTRTSCWINFIPANGLLMVPEGGSGCLCPFPNAATVVFQARKQNRAWAYYSTPGPMTPVKRLALNLGAPGDRRASDGSLWLGYPRPGGSLVLRFRTDVSLLPGGGYFRHDPARLQIADTDKPWVFHSGVRGVRRCVVPLVGTGEGTARYTVRLAFADLDQGAAGTRVFDIKLQDKLALKDFDPAREAGGRNKAIVKEFKGVEVAGKLQIDFVAKAKKPTPEQLPILQGIEIVREKVLGLGVLVPAFELQDAKPEQTGEVRLANFAEKGFSGTLRIEAPDGFTITPAASPLQLPCGKKAAVSLKAVVARKGKRGKYPVAITLVRQDGEVAWKGQTEIDYLGTISRVTLKAIEDAYVVRAAADANKGAEARVAVDGGNPKPGDQGHAIAYLKFKLAVPGTPVAVMLRLFNAGNPTGDSGQVCLLTEPWSEKTITYNNRPKPGRVLAKIGRVAERQVVELPLKLTEADLQGKAELSFVLDPTSTDGVDYISREGGKPAELVIEYEAKE